MNKTAIEIGGILRSARETRNITIETIATTLKIRGRYLMALEEGSITEFPSLTYLMGYLKTYADYLGLNSIAIIAQFKAEKEHAPHYPELLLPEPYRKDFHPKPAALLLSIFLLITIYGLWYCYHNKYHIFHSHEQSLADTFNSFSYLNYSPLPTDNVAPATLSIMPKTTASYKNKQSDTSNAIVLLAKATSWIKVMDNNNQLIAERVLNAGDTYFIAKQEGIVITAGNPDAIEVLHDGELSKLGKMAIKQSTISSNR